MRRLVPLTLTAMMTLGACEQSSPNQTNVAPSSNSQWASVNLDALTPKQAAQRERAIAARDLLASTLKGELVSAIQSNGPVHAIDVCHTRAPEIAREVAAIQDVLIGRDANRRRNPENTGPEWARTYQDSKLSIEIACENTDGDMGFAFPIMLEGACVVCHGTDEQIPDSVREAINERYPNDTATGFAPGDHRGWFWVQVPSEN